MGPLDGNGVSAIAPSTFPALFSSPHRSNDEIVVYCSNVACPASIMAYQILRSEGYNDICRYAGGLEDWEAAGYPLEGEMVKT